jgi:cysteine desulfurase
MIYFDTAASYPLLPGVKLTLSQAFEDHYANSSSGHYLGGLASSEVSRVREQLADAIGAYPSEVIFTSGATESNNIAFKSVLLGDKNIANKKHVVTSQIEHKCVFSLCDYLKTLGYEITYIKPNTSGIIDASTVKNALRDDTALVSIMHVNNELGSINPIAGIGAVCAASNVLFHSDAAQSFGKVSIDVDELNVDLMSISAHKIAGPKGIGAIYIRDLRKKELIPVIHGAGQEEGVRGGTVSSPLISAFGKAIELFPACYTQFKLVKAKEYLLDCLMREDILYKVNGDKQAVANCLSLTLPNTNVALMIRENEQVMCLSQGSACSSKEIQASHVLTSIGLDPRLADKTIRISFTLDVSLQDVEVLISAIKKASE